VASRSLTCDRREQNLPLLPGCHLEFSIFGYISVVNEDIFVKIDTLADIGHIGVTVAQYLTLAKFKMAGAAILDLYFCGISR